MLVYDRRFAHYFDCAWRGEYFKYYHTFFYTEAFDLKKALESQAGGAQFWDLRVYRVKLISPSKMLYAFS